MVRASSLRNCCISRFISCGLSGIGSSTPLGAGAYRRCQSRRFHTLMPNSLATVAAVLPLLFQCATTERLNSSSCGRAARRLFGSPSCSIAFFPKLSYRCPLFWGKGYTEVYGQHTGNLSKRGKKDGHSSFPRWSGTFYCPAAVPLLGGLSFRLG